jgi:hypothetical protein
MWKGSDNGCGNSLTTDAETDKRMEKPDWLSCPARICPRERESKWTQVSFQGRYIVSDDCKEKLRLGVEE